jgi:RimJ/RimL family protein N-acetyltransferase
MLRYAFDELHFERVEFKTDVLNERAKQGLRKVGGIEEGVPSKSHDLCGTIAAATPFISA